MDIVTLALAKSYIDKKIGEEGIVTGATPQQAAQIEQNKTNIADLQAEVEGLKESGGNGSGDTVVVPGKDGITPHIGENGNWYLGDTDTGVKAVGEDGYTPIKGVDYFTEADVQEIAGIAAEIVPGGGGGGIPFSNVTTKLIVDMTIPTDENGALPTYVEVTQRDDGTPLNLKAFVMQSDIKTGASYTLATYNDNNWQTPLPSVGHGQRTKATTIIVTKDGSLFSPDGLYPVGCYIGSETKGQPKVDAINKIKIPGMLTLESGTFLKIWEIVEVTDNA